MGYSISNGVFYGNERLKIKIERGLSKIYPNYNIHFMNAADTTDVLHIKGKIKLDLPFDWKVLKKRFPNLREQEIIDTVESIIKDKEKELIVNTNCHSDDCGDSDCNSGLNKPLKANYMHYTASFQDIKSSEVLKTVYPSVINQVNTLQTHDSKWKTFENQEPILKRILNNLKKGFWKFNDWLNSL
ncbi:MAG: hypothetical protein WC554_13650 [Clostridia bacterium]|jgi:hypothetical protein